MIGEFEEKLLMAVIKNGDDAYGTTIYKTLEQWDRKANLGSIYTTLNRLEDKGWVESKEGEPTKIRGGRRKKYYTVTGSGVQELNEARQQRSTIEGSFDWQTWGLT